MELVVCNSRSRNVMQPTDLGDSGLVVVDDERLDDLLDSYDVYEKTISELEHRLEEELGLRSRLKRCRSGPSGAASTLPGDFGQNCHAADLGFASFPSLVLAECRSAGSIASTSVRQLRKKARFQPFRKTIGLDPKDGAAQEPGPTHFYKPSCMGWSPQPHRYKDAAIGVIYPTQESLRDFRCASCPSKTGSWIPPRPGFRKTIGLNPKLHSDQEPGPTAFCRNSCIGWSPHPHKYSDSSIGAMFRPPCRPLSESGNWKYSRRMVMQN